MSYKELGISVNMPAIGNAYSIKVDVSGCEPTFGDEDKTQSFKLSLIQWKTYCDELNYDVHHLIYDQWMCGKDLLDMLEQVHKLIEKLSE